MESTQNTLSVVGKKPRSFARRVSAADLSEKVRSRIVTLMQFHEDADRAAFAAQKEYPSFRITGKTVLEIMVLVMAAKPTGREVSVMSARRTA